jgi:hypothetical protein
MAAKTVFVMLYVGAVGGAGRWLRPDQVTRMTDAQAGCVSEAERLTWATASLASGKGEIQGRWYTSASLAWNSFAWFASEPDSLIALIGRSGRKLRDHLNDMLG